MIILRKIDGGKSCEVVMSDTLSGIADGTNQTFGVTYEYTPGSIQVIYNGQTLVSPEDFSETGPKEITFTYVAPTEITVMRANYEIGDCDYDGSDDPAASSFLELTDTPHTYAGSENYYVKVNSDGTGLEFVLPDGGETQEGIHVIPDGVSSTAISFPHSFSSDEYILTVGLENKLDSEPSVYPVLIKNKTATGFTVDFSGEIDSANYYLNWRATISGTSVNGGSCTCSGCLLEEESSPSLSNNLDVGDNLIMLDAAPNGMSIHGYEIGHSGEASEMYVLDNPTGFGCPLYMRSDGRWAACTAASGTNQMPCVALALEEDDGGVKKIFWKGNIRKGNWSWTPGDKIYVSTVEGAITNVEPNGGAEVQEIGIAISSDTIRFDPKY